MRRTARTMCVPALCAIAVACGGVGPAKTIAAPTFVADIAPLLSSRCGACHRPGQPAPFSVDDYEAVRSHARRIEALTKSRVMPPWLPEPGHGEFADARVLGDDEIALIGRWVSLGAPRGEPGGAPPPRVNSEGGLGAAGLSVAMATPYTLMPSSSDRFRNFVIPVPPAGVRYVRGVALRGVDMKVIHHAVLMVDRTGASRRLDEADAEPGFEGMDSEGAASPPGHFVGWTPGKQTRLEAADMSWRLDPGADLILQVHMMPAAAPVAIQATLDLFLSPTPPTRTPFLVKLSSKTMDIPPGASTYTVSDQYVLPADVDLLSIYPHAHYLAKQIKATVTVPGANPRSLIWIKAWDFRWQDIYRYKDPVFLPRGSIVAMEYEYDNSGRHAHAATTPPVRVVYGPNSSDEMADLWLQVLPRNPADIDVLARDHIQRERRSQIAGAERALERDPNDAGRRNLLGAQYVEEGRLADAREQFERALRINPNHVEAHNNLASALDSMGRSADAIAHYEAAVRLRPNDGRIHFNLAAALQRQGRMGDAVPHYQRAAALNPDAADFHNNLAVALASQGRIREAITHLERAVALDDEYADAHSNLGMALASSGDLRGATAHLQRALAIQPGHADARSNLAVVQQWGQAGRR